MTNRQVAPCLDLMQIMNTVLVSFEVKVVFVLLQPGLFTQISMEGCVCACLIQYSYCPDILYFTHISPFVCDNDTIYMYKTSNMQEVHSIIHLKLRYGTTAILIS